MKIGRKRKGRRKLGNGEGWLGKPRARMEALLLQEDDDSYMLHQYRCSSLRCTLDLYLALHFLHPRQCLVKLLCRYEMWKPCRGLRFCWIFGFFWGGGIEFDEPLLLIWFVWWDVKAMFFRIIFLLFNFIFSSFRLDLVLERTHVQILSICYCFV